MIIETVEQQNKLYRLIGQQIKIKRIKLNLSQEKLAEICGISQKYLSFIETGKAKARLAVYVNIANALCVSFDYLIEDFIDNSKTLTIEEAVLQMKKMDISQQEIALDFMTKMKDFFEKYNEKPSD